MIKKVIFVVSVLAIGLWSCSQNDDIDDNVSDGDYVDVTVGVNTKGLKSIVYPTGGTSWDLDDYVTILDVDGAEQKFVYSEESAMSSGIFKGKLKSNQGPQEYMAYHIPDNITGELGVNSDNHYTLCVSGSTDITITEDGITSNSEWFGKFCPMIAIPARFDAGARKQNTNPKEFLLQFHHLTSMIEGRVSFRQEVDEQYMGITFDRIKFEVKATNAVPFYTKAVVDLTKYDADSQIEDLNECILNFGKEEDRVSSLSTTMIMGDRTIGDLLEEYKLSKLEFFPIPIFALPTDVPFLYTASITFYDGDELKLKLEGDGDASGLSPAGLNVLNFDYRKVVEVVR